MSEQPTWMDEKLDWQAGEKPIQLGSTDNPIYHYHRASITGELNFTAEELKLACGLLDPAHHPPTVTAYFWRGHVLGAAGVWWNWQIRLGRIVVAYRELYSSQEPALVDLKDWIASRRPRKEPT